MLTLDTSVADKIWDNWLRMWNEDSDIAHAIISPAGYVLHLPDAAATIDPSTISGPADMAKWVAGFTGKFEGLRYTTDFGPFVDGNERRFAYRWIGTGRWTGATGWPHDIPGQEALFVGVDIFQVDESLQITECWSQGAVTRTT
ncbi:hypothetical protein ACFV16_17010 [Streptomyces massasporeus]|uniref:hypothetical protein n=1 Tax=Streptomyces massasporeus TaxID=67324 RepID=UPI00367D5A6E